MTFIGLAGTLSAGKDSLANALAERHQLLHMSTSDMIRAMKRREFGDSPEALLVRNDPYINQLRADRGPGFLVDAVYEEWQAKREQYPGGVIASGIRAIGEAEAVHSKGGMIVFVDADPEIRYNRTQSRLRDANETGKTFDEFMATEQSEIGADPSDKSVQNLLAMKEMSDSIIMNNGDDLEQFVQEAENQLKLQKQ